MEYVRSRRRALLIQNIKNLIMVAGIGVLFLMGILTAAYGYGTKKLTTEG